MNEYTNIKEVPCKQCLVQPMCKVRCDELLYYGKSLEEHKRMVNVRYKVYLKYSKIVFNRMFYTQEYN